MIHPTFQPTVQDSVEPQFLLWSNWDYCWTTAQCTCGSF